MKLLPITFHHHGFTYRQLERSRSAALYAVSGGGFEVVRIRVAKARLIALTGTTVPEREIYPSDGEFGVYGWYYPASQEKAALAQFEKVSAPSHG